MAKLPVSSLYAGARLGADVTDHSGRFIMPRGTALTDSHIRFLAGFALSEVEIEDAPADAPATPASDPGVRDKAARLTAASFSQVDKSHPAAAALFDLCVDRLAARLAAQGGGGPAIPTPEELIALIPPGESPPVPSMDELLSKDLRLISPPEVFMRIIAALKDPGSGSNLIADLVGKDPGLSATLLKIVNSSFYSRAIGVSPRLAGAKVDSLARAVTLVGTAQLATLAMGVCVMPRFHDLPDGLVDVRSFWRHSIFCGVMARMLHGIKAGDDAASGERLFICGLLHDVGRLILLRHLPIIMGEALVAARLEKRSLTATETGHLGFNHAQVGGLLLKKWQYPPYLENAVARHHDPDQAEDKEGPAVVHVADFIAVALGVCGSGECLVPALNPAAWDILGLDPAVLPELALSAETQVEEIFASFFPEPPAKHKHKDQRQHGR